MYNKLVSSLIGIGLVLVGIAALAGNFMLSLINPNLNWWDAWRLWPMLVLGAGLVLGLLGVGSIKQRGLGMLFIPAMPILTTGGILLIASLFEHWSVWALLWPLEVLALAFGFLMAAVFARIVWLGIPAIIIGLNGLVLAFCNTTHLWSAWSVLWTVEPLAVGLVLLLIAAKTRSMAVTIVGLSFCGAAGLAFTGMTALLAFDGILFRIAGPAFLIVLGGGLVLSNWLKRPTFSTQSVNDAQ